MHNTTKISTAYIGLGSNIGNGLQNITDAIVAIAQNSNICVVKKSHFYKTEPIEADGGYYTNSAICINTKYNPFELLKFLQYIEDQFGRKRLYFNSPRELDLDLLLFEQQIISTKELTLPHPRITDRAFVIVPLLDLNINITLPPHSDKVNQFLPQVSKQIINKIKANKYANCLHCGSCILE